MNTLDALIASKLEERIATMVSDAVMRALDSIDVDAVLDSALGVTPKSAPTKITHFVDKATIARNVATATVKAEANNAAEAVARFDKAHPEGLPGGYRNRLSSDPAWVKTRVFVGPKGGEKTKSRPANLTDYLPDQWLYIKQLSDRSAWVTRQSLKKN